MTKYLVLVLMACAPHECELDRECPDAGGWCEVPATHCAAPFAPACREYHCTTICPCDVRH